jgi:hypothetical protein
MIDAQTWTMLGEWATTGLLTITVFGCFMLFGDMFVSIRSDEHGEYAPRPMFDDGYLKAAINGVLVVAIAVVFVVGAVAILISVGWFIHIINELFVQLL